MKIVHFLYELVSGGAERFVVDLANAQVEAGHDVTVCMLRPFDDRTGFNRQFLASGVHFVPLNVASGISIGKLKIVSDFLSLANPDVLHCHHNILPYLALWLPCRKNTVVVHTVHSAADRAYKNVGERIYTWFLYKLGLVHPVAISSECRKSFKSVYGIEAACINNGRASSALTGAFEQVKKEIDGYRSSTDTKVFIHVGRCHPVKNQDLLVDSFNALEREGVDFTLLVIGAAFDSELGRALREKSCKRIHYLGEKNNVADYLMNSDAFCLSSFSEGLSISLIEALQCGVTPICTPVGGNPDVVIDGKTGYMSADLSMEAYLKALHRYLADPLDRVSLQEFFNDNFSMTSCCTKYVELYRSLMKQ